MGSRTGVRVVIVEALIIAVAGALMALLANAVSPRGLMISRNYFPPPPKTARAAAAPSLTSTNSGTNTASSQAALIERLEARGLSHVDREQAQQAYTNQDYTLNLIAFIDARDDKAYQEGHIPGAYQLDYYHPEQSLGTVLAVSQVARQLIVYCNGGNCEDSELTATLLRDAGVPNEKLFVYLGGFADWKTNNLPVELGARMSGTILPGGKQP